MCAIEKSRLLVSIESGGSTPARVISAGTPVTLVKLVAWDLRARQDEPHLEDGSVYLKFGGSDLTVGSTTTGGDADREGLINPSISLPVGIPFSVEKSKSSEKR